MSMQFVEEIDDYADENDMSRSEFIRTACQDFMDDTDAPDAENEER